MPALIAHHLHGLDVLQAWPPASGMGESARLAFLLGCQGPDPLFFVLRTPSLAAWRRLGSRMHAGLVAECLDAMRQAAAAAPPRQREALAAYVRGWLCHLTLDSLAHPLVFSWERAICAAGAPGLDAGAHGEVHAQIEADLDASLLWRRRGLTIAGYKPTEELLLGPDALLTALGGLYQAAAAAYGASLPRWAYRASLKDMRLSYDVVYSPDGRRRDRLGRLERLARPHSLAQAVSHRVDVGPASDYDNTAHEPWRNPFSGEEDCSSFEDIFAAAVALAARRQLLYTDAAPSTELVGTLNFEGASLQ